MTLLPHPSPRPQTAWSLMRSQAPGIHPPGLPIRMMASGLVLLPAALANPAARTALTCKTLTSQIRPAGLSDAQAASALC